MTDNPPAFPAVWPDAGYEPTYGMSLRDWFAGQALATVNGAAGSYGPDGRKQIAENAYAMADAMLAERRSHD